MSLNKLNLKASIIVPVSCIVVTVLMQLLFANIFVYNGKEFNGIGISVGVVMVWALLHQSPWVKWLTIVQNAMCIAFSIYVLANAMASNPIGFYIVTLFHLTSIVFLLLDGNFYEKPSKV